MSRDRDWTTEHRLGKIIGWHYSLKKDYGEEWYDSLTDAQINGIYDDYLKWVSRQLEVS